MKLFNTFFGIIIASQSILSTAGEVEIPNTFSAGTPAVAAEVNANFQEVDTAVDDNAVRIAALEAALTTLQTQNTSLQAAFDLLEEAADDRENRIVNLEATNLQLTGFIEGVLPYLEGGTDAQGNPGIFFSGANVHINNGEGSTATINGRGNLIIGYDEAFVSEAFNNASQNDFCSVANLAEERVYTDQASCEANNGIWGKESQKIGSHNVVIGRQHSYTQFGGLVAGFNNTIAGPDSNVLGGRRNAAIGVSSSVSGGIYNAASGRTSSVSGGFDNTASGVTSSVSGGTANTASGRTSSVSGGRSNTASGSPSSVSGGGSNTASDSLSSVSGGSSNTASGFNSSVSGGSSNTASGFNSSVSGGSDREATGFDDWRAGSLFEER